jgi:hypothetical protein
MSWGQGTTTAHYMDTVIANLQLGRGNLSEDEWDIRSQEYFDAMSLSADYILGGNQNGLVYITGLGTRHVEEPLHLDSLAFIKMGKGPMPGIPVYGPVDDINHVYYTEPARLEFYPPFEDQPPGLRYGDVRTFVMCNEFTSWETQAPLVEMFSLLIGDSTMPGDLSATECGIDWCFE